MDYFEIHPRSDCPHAAAQAPAAVPAGGVVLGGRCSAAGCPVAFGVPSADGSAKSAGVNPLWACVTCGAKFCGRAQHGHGVAHARATGHCLLLGEADLSFWCYGPSEGCAGCDGYVDQLLIPSLHGVYTAFHVAKFGEAPPQGAMPARVLVTPGRPPPHRRRNRRR